jgi:hypothetical protein
MLCMSVHRMKPMKYPLDMRYNSPHPVVIDRYRVSMSYIRSYPMHSHRYPMYTVCMYVHRVSYYMYRVHMVYMMIHHSMIDTHHDHIVSNR